MKRYMIEREMPGAGDLSDAELKAASMKSVNVLGELGPKIQWVHSYVMADKIFCFYLAENPDDIVEHAKCVGIPASRVTEVRKIIDPMTAFD